MKLPLCTKKENLTLSLPKPVDSNMLQTYITSFEV